MEQRVTTPAVATFPETPVQRLRAHRRRASHSGLVRVEVSVPVDMAPVIRFAAKLLRDGPLALRIRLLRFLLILREAAGREAVATGERRITTRR